MDDMFTGAHIFPPEKGTGTTLEDALKWREWSVGGWTGPCFSIRAADVRNQMLVPSTEWHSVDDIRMATSQLNDHVVWSSCSDCPEQAPLIGSDSFPKGALAFIEWEAGRPVGVTDTGLCIKAALSPELFEVYWERRGRSTGFGRHTLEQRLQATPFKQRLQVQT